MTRSTKYEGEDEFKSLIWEVIDVYFVGDTEHIAKWLREVAEEVEKEVQP